MTKTHVSSAGSTWTSITKLFMNFAMLSCLCPAPMFWDQSQILPRSKSRRGVTKRLCLANKELRRVDMSCLKVRSLEKRWPDFQKHIFRLINPAKHPCALNPFHAWKFPGSPRFQWLSKTLHDFPGFSMSLHNFPRLPYIRSRPGNPMNFAHFCEFWCFSLVKQARSTLNFCSGMPPGKVHELTLLWFGLPGPLLITPHFRSPHGLQDSPVRTSISSWTHPTPTIHMYECLAKVMHVLRWVPERLTFGCCP